MTRTARISLFGTLILALAACSTASSPDDESIASVEAALELEDGGFDTETPEAPMFGYEDFEQAWMDDLDPMTEPLAGDAPLVRPDQEPPEDACAHGRLQGRFRELRDGLGVGRGRVLGPEGRVIGHMRFIWGTRRDGTHVAFGKVIDLEGRARGVFRGVAQDGEFHGRWVRRNGNHGVMAGRYFDPRRLPGGVFAGRWHRVDCDEDEEESVDGL
jgi:hypothetical protein